VHHTRYVSSTGERRRQRASAQVDGWRPRLMHARDGVHLTSDVSRTPLEECDELLSAIRQALGPLRRGAQSADLVIIGASGSIPVLLLLSTHYLDFYLGKLVPALLAALSAAMALAIKLTRPHERWRLLRFHQAHIEAERFRYLHHLGDYAGDDRDDHLLNGIVKASEEIAVAWSEFLPESEKAAQMLQSGGK
jgi:hypothetical protein